MAPDTEGLSFIIDFFKDKPQGYLIDVGACDGMQKGSMTRHFLKQRWSGMLIEPNPKFYSELLINYLTRPDVVTEQVACSDENGVIDLFPFRGVSTVEPEWRDVCAERFPHVKYGDPISVKKRTLKSLLEKHKPSSVDFLDIDTEGHGMKVLKGMDWNYKPSLICAEVIDFKNFQRKKKGIWEPSPELIKYLGQLKYLCVKLTRGGNAIFIRESLYD